MLDPELIATLVSDLESYRVERKSSMTGNKSAIEEALCAFANDLPASGEAGVLLVGVDDDGAPSGIPITDQLLQSLSSIRSDGNILPFPQITVSKAQLLGVDIAVVEVIPSKNTPLRLRGRVRIRVGPRRDTASMQGLRNLGPTLIHWRKSWKDRLDRNPAPELSLPLGTMNALGYLVMQAGMRLHRPVKAYERWVSRMPGVYHEELVRDGVHPLSTDEDTFCLGVMRHYQSLMPLAQDTQKPMFMLKPADGAIGAHTKAVERCGDEFFKVARRIVRRIKRT